MAKLTLNLGENKISARARDSEGNISKTTEMIVVVYNEPPRAPTGLATAVQDYQVQLTWNPNTEPDVLGYNLYRKGERINAPVAVNPEDGTTWGVGVMGGWGQVLQYYILAFLVPSFSSRLIARLMVA